MIEISEPIKEFHSCNGCGRYNKRGPGPEAMYRSLCKNIRRNQYGLFIQGYGC